MQAYETLEKEFAAWIGCQPAQAVAVSSGTAALHLGLEVLQLPALSEVIVPDFTMIACPRAVTLAGLVPVLVDCKRDLCMDMDYVDEAASANLPGAVMAVHIYGRQCDMNGLSALKSKYGFMVMEDMAELHGCQPHANTDVAAWSFYKNKIVAGEEGGMLYVKDVELAGLARRLRSLGFTEAHDFMHVPRGHNYRMSNVHAELVLKSLRMVDVNTFMRRAAEQAYDCHCPGEWMMQPRESPWVYDMRIPGISRSMQQEIVKELNHVGIQARMSFAPVSIQPEYSGKCRLYNNSEWPVALDAAHEVLYLPLTPGGVTHDLAKRCFQVIKPYVS